MQAWGTPSSTGASPRASRSRIRSPSSSTVASSRGAEGTRWSTSTTATEFGTTSAAPEIAEGGESRRRRPSLRMEALDELASALRSRLIERAREGAASGGLEDEVRALVEEEAGPLAE